MVKKLVAVCALVVLMSLLAGCVVQSKPAGSGNTVTMGPNNYIGGVSGAGGNSTYTLTIKKGQTIVFTDDKNTGSMHILVIGANGQAKSEPGAPDFGANGQTFQPGQTWTSPPWMMPGTYDVSCTVHPQTMNLKVTVTS